MITGLGDLCSNLCCTFVGTGHPLNGSFIIVVLSYRESEDPHLRHEIQLNNIYRHITKIFFMTLEA